MDSSTSEPLISAHVHIPSLDIGIVTNENGEFELITPTGEFEIYVRFIGYEDYIEIIQVKEGWTIVEIQLNTSISDWEP